MRTLVALSVLALSAASAHAAEDRYGPPPTAATVSLVPGQPAGASTTAPAYTGRMLGWTGKSASAPIAPAGAVQPGPQAMARAAVTQQSPWIDRRGGAVAFQPQSPAPAPVPAGRPVPQQQAALPRSLYDQPIAPAPARAATPVPFQPQQPRPQPAPAPVLPTAPVAQRAPSLPPPPSAEGQRAYSVSREFTTPGGSMLPPPTSYWATRQPTAPTGPAIAEPVLVEGEDFAASTSVGEDPDTLRVPERKARPQLESGK